MGHTNATVNYNLPQFVGTDKPSWLGDVNGAFLAIDSAIAAAKTEADSAAGGVAGLQVTVGSHTTQIGTLTDTVTAQGGTLNSVTALIGNGVPTTTDKTIIGAINELNADLTNLFSIETFDFYTKTGSNMGIPANGEASTDVNIAKTGYTPIMAIVELTGSVACFAYQSEINGDYLKISIHNTGSARVEVSPHVRIVYLKD